MDIKRNDSISVIVHDFAVVGPIPAANMSLAKGLAAERARQVLGDQSSPYFLTSICDCAEEAEAKAAEVAAQEEEMDGVPVKRLDDETEEGFAKLAQIALTEVQAEDSPTAVGTDEDVHMEVDVEETAATVSGTDLSVFHSDEGANSAARTTIVTVLSKADPELVQRETITSPFTLDLLLNVP